MSVVVLGAGGLLGQHLLRTIPNARGFDRAACDITDRAAVDHVLADAVAVINCAAFTNVDKAETESDAAWRANALGAENVALVAAARDVRAIHVSTDFVFDGTKTTPYDELDRPQPLSVYARSKWAGEELFLRAAPRGAVVRVQGLYGAGGANFASKLPELLRSGKPLKLDAERLVQPTWAGSAARQIARLVNADAGGLFHVSCTGSTTWASFTRRLAGKLGIAPTFTEVPTSALVAPAARPPNCVFEHRMLRLRGLFDLPTWESAQDAFLDDRQV